MPKKFTPRADMNLFHSEPMASEKVYLVSARYLCDFLPRTVCLAEDSEVRVKISAKLLGFSDIVVLAECSRSAWEAAHVQ